MNLGRIAFLDRRSRGYDVAAILGTAKRPACRGWHVPVVLDQLKGRTTQRDQMGCVGYSWAAELAADPVRIPVNNDSGLSIYYGAQDRDAFLDEAGGTALLFGAQEVQARGYIDSYRWAFNPDDLVGALAVGPVLLASAWTEGMDEPSRQGVVHPTGKAYAGHAYLARGYNLSKRFRIGHNRYTKTRAYLACLNSLGRSYGVCGRFWLPVDEWETDLMHHARQPAEACVPVGRKRP